MSSPRYRRWTGILALLLVVILVVGNGLHPPLPKESLPALMMIAGYGPWSIVHLLILSSYLVLIPVACGVAASFVGEYPQVRIGVQLVVFGAALGAVYITIHLTMLTYLARQFTLTTDAVARANIAFLYDLIYPLADAFDVISLFAIFAAVILYGTAMRRDRLYPAWLGAVAIGGGGIAAVGRLVHEAMQTTTGAIIDGVSMIPLVVWLAATGVILLHTAAAGMEREPTARRAEMA